MRIAYVSGHLDLTKDEFLERYFVDISNAVKRGDWFVVGDARGTDVLAQELIHALGGSCTVYHMFEKPRNNPHNFPTVGGFKTDEDRDEEMTKASHYDIAWVRNGRENSGTAKNLERRKKWNAKIDIVCPHCSHQFVEGEVEVLRLIRMFEVEPWMKDHPDIRPYLLRLKTLLAVG